MQRTPANLMLKKTIEIICGTRDDAMTFGSGKFEMFVEYTRSLNHWTNVMSKKMDNPKDTGKLSDAWVVYGDLVSKGKLSGV